jgi:hypothetical protein
MNKSELANVWPPTADVAREAGHAPTCRILFIGRFAVAM